MAAKSGMARFGTCTITNNKRLMNMSISDKELTDAAAHSTCKVVPNNDGVNYEVEWEGNTTLRTPDQVHTLLYRKLHGTLEVYRFSSTVTCIGLLSAYCIVAYRNSFQLSSH